MSRPRENNTPLEQAPEPLKLFTIPVARICTKTYAIPARDKHEAEAKAYDKAVDDNWDDETPDFEVYSYISQ